MSLVWSPDGLILADRELLEDGSWVVELKGFLEKHEDGEWVAYAYDEHNRHLFLGKMKNKNSAKALIRKSTTTDP